jgi:hypothetical protein
MRAIRLAICALVVATVARDAQTSPALELRLQPQSIREGIPQEFVIEIVNTSDQDVRIPAPTLQCSDSLNGYVWLELDFHPLAKDAPQEGYGCFLDSFEWPDILTRAEKWKVLHAGDTLTLKADTAKLHYGDAQPGTYEFWATYSPPSVAPDDEALLLGAGIDFARKPLASKHLSFKKAAE